jgi:transcriptional regulator with XRE-family HTH domain
MAGEAMGAAEPSGIPAVAGGSVERLSGTGLFSEEFKAQRSKRGWTQPELAKKLNYSNSYISDIERGAQSPTLDLAQRCDGLYGLPGTFIRLYGIAKGAEEYPAWFESVVVPFEVKAAYINGFVLGTFPGLLQTEDYARELIRGTRQDATDQEVQRLVAMRMGRQGIFENPAPPLVWWVIDEGAFRRVVGGTDVMSVQVDKLIAVASVPGNVIQVLPFAVGAGLGGDGPLTIFELPENRQLVGYAECYRGGRLVQDAAEASEMLRKLNLIRAHALSPRDSVAWMHALRSDLTDD